MPETKNKPVYGGIDINEWHPFHGHNNLGNNIDLPHSTKIAAQIGQITSWKNHIDFVKAASIIKQETKAVHSIITGENLSGNESDYYDRTKAGKKGFGLRKHFTFFANTKDIRSHLKNEEMTCTLPKCHVSFSYYDTTRRIN